MAADESNVYGDVDPDPVGASFRIFERAGVPFVAEAIGARIVEIEELPGLAAARGDVLARAGMVAGDQAQNVALTVGRAIEMRLADPPPALVIVCRLRGTEALAVRQLERERGLPRVPMLVSGGTSVPRMLTVARGIGAGAVHDRWRCDGALLECVVRLAWPDAFARACEGLGIDASARPWPESTAPVDAPIESELHPEGFTAALTERYVWAGSLVDVFWQVDYDLEHPDRWASLDAAARPTCIEPSNPPARLVDVVEQGLAAGYLTPDEAAVVGGDDGAAAREMARSIRERSIVRYTLEP